MRKGILADSPWKSRRSLAVVVAVVVVVAAVVDVVGKTMTATTYLPAVATAVAARVSPWPDGSCSVHCWPQGC